MGLSKDIENAFLKSMGNPEDKGNIPELAKDISSAFINFLQKQEFNITEMKAIVKLDELSTTGDLSADVKSSVQAQMPVQTVMLSAGVPNPIPIPLPISTISGKKGIRIPRLKLKSRSGQGGSMNGVGYAYVGRNNPVSPNESNENKTTVKLLKVVEE